MNDHRERDARLKLNQAIGLLAAVHAEGSFAGAAQQLDLDPSAVSHRIRALEAALGLSLFERTTRRVRPTRAGTLLCEASARALSELERSLTAARQLGSSATIRLSVHSSLAMKWLVPRLPSAQSAGLDLSIDVREELVDIAGSDVDAGFRFGPGPYPGLHATRLANGYLQPVVGAAHPAARRASVDLLADDDITLLSDLGAEKYRTGTTWIDYRRALGQPDETERPVKPFDRADLMLQAAIGGLGVALGRNLLIDDDVRQGLLVPVGDRLRAASAYWLVTTPELAKTPMLVSLTKWLQEQIAWSLRAAS